MVKLVGIQSKTPTTHPNKRKQFHKTIKTDFTMNKTVVSFYIKGQRGKNYRTFDTLKEAQQFMIECNENKECDGYGIDREMSKQASEFWTGTGKNIEPSGFPHGYFND